MTTADREYVTPSKLPEESNWEYCQRAANAIPPEKIVADLLRYLNGHRPRGTASLPLWSIVGYATGNGSGFSSAIVAKYLPEASDQ